MTTTAQESGTQAQITLPDVDGVVDDLTFARFLSTADFGPIQAGESVLGEAQGEELDLLCKWSLRLDRMDDLEADVSAASFHSIGDMVREARGKFTGEVMNKHNDQLRASKKEQFHELFKLRYECEYLSARFFFLIYSRLGHYDCHVAIRNKKQIVAGSRKW